MELQKSQSKKQSINWITPKHWIKNPQEAQNSTCNICYEIITKPIRCAGPCKALFCFKCFEYWKIRSPNGHCPQRCSVPFVVQQAKLGQVLFICPFNSQKCTIQIKGVQQFQKHSKVCENIPQAIKKQIQYKQNYKCNAGHNLEFYIGTFKQIVNRLCSCCNQIKLARYCCRKCDQFYCFECQKIQCSKKCCPRGHHITFYRQAVQDQSYICDICGQHTYLKGKGGIYHDMKCNFGMCQSCYKELPDQVPNPVKNVISNNFYKCQNEHELHTLLQGKQENCRLCQKKKLCYRACFICKTFYCYKCKLPWISEGSCQLNHQLVHVNQRQKFNKQDKTVLLFNNKKDKCNRCLFHMPTLIDQKCQLKLCQNCFEYSNQMRDQQKDKLLNNYQCTKNHPLIHLSYKQRVFKKCSICLQEKTIIFYCQFCRKNRFFCCACIYPKKGECYLGHELKIQKQGKVNICSVCQQDKTDKTPSEIFSCSQGCNFRVCLDCQSIMGKNKNVNEQ